MSFPPLLAALPFPKDQASDDIMRAFAEALAGQGVRVAGIVQVSHCEGPGCEAEVTVEDIEGGLAMPIMQSLGAQSNGCRVDPQAMADVAGHLLSLIETGPDLLLINRFGKLEVEGEGLRAVFEAAILRSIPVLTSVKEAFLPAFDDFAGECGLHLPRNLAALTEWSAIAIDAARRLREAA